MKFLRSNLTSAHAIALIALFVALSSSAGAAGVKLITGADVKDHSLTEADVKRGSLTSASLKKGSLRVNNFDPREASRLVGGKGDKGDQGAKGETGVAGTAGTKGDTGIAGAAGSQGSKGDAGAAGTDGAKGDTGAAGASGDPGAAGANGDPGAAGAVGPQGPNGDTGAAGPQGPPGIDANLTILRQDGTDITDYRDGESIVEVTLPERGAYVALVRYAVANTGKADDSLSCTFRLGEVLAQTAGVQPTAGTSVQGSSAAVLESDEDKQAVSFTCFGSGTTTFDISRIRVTLIRLG